MKIEKPIIIELYELWNAFKSRFSIISPQPKSFELSRRVVPVTSLDGETIELIDLSDDTSVAAAGAITVQLQPPKGFLYEVIYIYYRANDPAGSAAGTHKVNFTYSGVSTTSPSIVCRGTTGTTIYITSYALIGDSAETPPSATQQFELIACGRLIASNSLPIDIEYHNDTDVAQAGTRTCEIVVRKRPEGAV